MATARGTVRDLRRHNRSATLRALLFDGPLSRAEVSRRTGLSLATIGNVATELLADRLIVEAGQVDSDGGRPRVLLRVDPGYGTLIGVDVGAGTVTAELFDLGMNRLAVAQRSASPPAATPAVLVELVCAVLDELLAAAGAASAEVIGVGIGVPGSVEQQPRVLVHAQVIDWAAVPFEELLRQAGVSLPLYFDNGAKTQAQAEMWFGAGRGARHAVIALICSGVGAAVVVDGATYQGATSSAGEWGHTTIVYGGRPCRCGARGCLEAYIGAEAILERYRQARGGRPVPGDDQESQLAALLAAAPTLATAARVLDETAGYLGAGVANLVNLFNPERIVLGGWAGAALGAQLLPRIRAQAQAYALAHPYRQAAIELGVLGSDAVAFSAATLPLAALLAQGGDPRERRRPHARRTARQPSAA
jgi:predicted NBD/HSP70 family sugar kinase